MQNNHQNGRIFLRYYDAEWELLERAAEDAGFSSARNFIYSQIHNSLDRIKPSGFVAQKMETKTFQLDLELYCRLEQMAQTYNMRGVHPLIRRLVTEPALARLLLEGRSGF